MCRDRFAIALLMSVAAVFAGATGCSGDKPAPASRTEEAARVTRSASELQSDTVSGCAYGAALVKVLIDLQPKDGHCVPEVTPASVCVAPAGVVRFKIQNGCPSLVQPDRPAVEITKPELKRRLAVPDRTGGLTDLFQNCTLSVPRIDHAAIHVIWCDIGADAFEGFYKYGLKGQIDPLDPDVEVRRGGTP